MRRAILAVSALALVLYALDGAASSVASPQRVTLIGDSVGARLEQVPSAAQALEVRLSVRTRLAVCRRLVSRSCSFHGVRPPTVLQEIRSLGSRIDGVVVIEVGYNDTPSDFAQGVDVIMGALTRRGAPHVVWVTLRERQPSYRDINRIIRDLKRQWPQVVRIADWSLVSAGQPWFEADAVHLNTDGANALATLIHASVVAACGKPCVTNAFDAMPLQRTPRGAPRCAQRAGGAWAAVLARTTTAQRALALQQRAIAAGFGQSVLVQPRPEVYEVVLFGFPDKAGATSIYLEARARGFRSSAVPNDGPCDDLSGDWEADFGHTATRAEAAALLARVQAAGFRDGSKIEIDEPDNFEVAVEGIESTSQFADFAAEALRAGFVVSFEPS